jgi:hypothetical protein
LGQEFRKNMMPYIFLKQVQGKIFKLVLQAYISLFPEAYGMLVLMSHDTFLLWAGI